MSASIPEPRHAEIQELLGAYALDAVDRETAAMVEHHLDGCLKCSTEVAQHHEVAGLLANSGGASPAGLWAGIAGQLDGSTPPSWESLSARLEKGLDRPDLTDAGLSAAPGGGTVDGSPSASNVIPITGERHRSRWVARATGTVAAAAVVAAVVLGVQVRHLDHQVNTLPAPLSAAEQSALNSPLTRQVRLTPPPGSTGAPSAKATVVLTKSGAGFVQAQHLSKLPTDQTYQLWGVIGQQTISLGLLGSHPNVVAFSVAGGVPVSSFAITAEHAGGVVQSANQPVVAGPLNA